MAAISGDAADSSFDYFCAIFYYSAAAKLISLAIGTGFGFTTTGIIGSFSDSFEEVFFFNLGCSTF